MNTDHHNGISSTAAITTMPCRLLYLCLSIIISTCIGLTSFLSPAFAESYQVDDTSYDFDTYMAQAKQRQADLINIGVEARILNDTHIDWNVTKIIGYRGGFFSGPYLAHIGTNKKHKPQNLTLNTGSDITIEYLYFESPVVLNVEKGTTATFKDVTFDTVPTIKGTAHFINCTFNGKAVNFEGGAATYVGDKPEQETGNKASSHTPLSFVPAKDEIIAVQGREFAESIDLQLDGSNKDRAEIQLEQPQDSKGLTFTLEGKQLVIKGTPTAAGELDLILTASAKEEEGHEADQDVSSKIHLKIHPQLELILEGELDVANKYSVKYQNNLKVKVKVGDAEPVDLYDFRNSDPDAREMEVPQVILEKGIPQGMRAYFENGLNQVIVAGDNPTPAGNYPIKLQMTVKGQTIESNTASLLIFDGDETLKHQLETQWLDEGRPKRWVMKPYFILKSEGAYIPADLKTLMGSDCFNSQEAKDEYDAGNSSNKPGLSIMSTHQASHLIARSLSNSYEFNPLIPKLAGADVVAMATAGSGGVVGGSSGGGGVGGSGSCYYGVLGKGENGNYATDPLYIPAGADVEFLNMKILSSIKIIVQTGGKLTLNDSAIHGLIEVEEGATLSGKYSSSTTGKIIFKDKSIMENLEIKSHANHLSDGNDTKPYPGAPVETEGTVHVRGVNHITGDAGLKDNDGRKSQPALKLGKNSHLIIEKGAQLTAQGGNSEIYTREGGDGIIMEPGSVIEGEGSLYALGGRGYEGQGGTGVSGEGKIEVAQAEIIGGEGKSVIGIDSPGGYGINGPITVDPQTKLILRGGDGVNADKTPKEATSPFNPEYPNPQSDKGVKIRVRYVLPSSIDAATGASISGLKDDVYKELQGETLPLSKLIKQVPGKKLSHIRVIKHVPHPHHTRSKRSTDMMASENAENHVADSAANSETADHSATTDVLRVPEDLAYNVVLNTIPKALIFTDPDVVLEAFMEDIPEESETEPNPDTNDSKTPEGSNETDGTNEAGKTSDTHSDSVNTKEVSEKSFSDILDNLLNGSSKSTYKEQSDKEVDAKIRRHPIPKTSDARSILPYGLVALAAVSFITANLARKKAFQDC